MDGQTERCLHCGATVTIGRFCTNCGARLGTEPTNPRTWPAATDTAERVYAAPSPAYAAGPEPALLTRESGTRRPSPGPGLWVGVAVAMVVMLVVGGFLLFRGFGGGDDTPAASTPIVPRTHATHEFFEGLHGLIAKLIIYVMVPLHVLAALKHQFVDKDEVMARMVPGLTPKPVMN